VRTTGAVGLGAWVACEDGPFVASGAEPVGSTSVIIMIGLAPAQPPSGAVRSSNRTKIKQPKRIDIPVASNTPCFGFLLNGFIRITHAAKQAQPASG
jgi:hypothetical protein